MENAGYLLLSRQLHAFEQLDVIANNVAQASPGSKQDFVVSTMKVANDVHDQLHFPQNAMTAPDWSDGDLRTTGREWDLAIQSYGEERSFFMVRTPQGIRYTRNGSFKLDASNRLVDLKNNPVLTIDGQDIIMEDEDVDPTVLSSGLIVVNGQDRDTIGVLAFSPQQARLLNKTPDGYFTGDAAGHEVEATNIVQGALEDPNGSTVANLSLLIELQREAGMVAKLSEDDHNLKRTTYRAIAQLSA